MNIMKRIVVSYFHRVSSLSKRKSVKKSENGEKSIKRFPIVITIRFKGENKGVSCVSGLYLSVDELDAARKICPSGEAAVHASIIKLALERAQAFVDILQPFSMEVCGYLLDRAKDSKDDILVDEKYNFDIRNIAPKFLAEYVMTNPGSQVPTLRDETVNNALVPVPYKIISEQIRAALPQTVMPQFKLKVGSVSNSQMQEDYYEVVDVDDNPAPTNTNGTVINNIIVVQGDIVNNQPQLTNSNFNPDGNLLTWIIETMDKKNGRGTKMGYNNAVAKLTEYAAKMDKDNKDDKDWKKLLNIVAGENHIAFRALEEDFFEKMIVWMSREGKKLKNGSLKLFTGGTIKTYLSYIKSAYEIAVEKGVITADMNPFGPRKCTLPAGRRLDRSLKPKEFAKLLKYKPSKLKIKCRKGEIGKYFSEEEAFEMYVMSYRLSGINFTDMLRMRWYQIESSQLDFKRNKMKRKKSHEGAHLKITADTWKLIYKWCTKDRDPDNFVFRVLTPPTPPEGFSDMKEKEKEAWYVIEEELLIRQINSYVVKVNRHLRIIGKKLGINIKKFTTYSARHTFANDAKDAGMDSKEVMVRMAQKTAAAHDHYTNREREEIQKKVDNLTSMYKKKKVSRKVA